MVKRLGFVSLWLVATLLSIAVGVQAVSSVRRQVADSPAPLGALSDQLGTTTTLPLEDGSSTTTAPASPTTTDPGSGTTATTEAPSSTTAATTTTTSAAPATSTTTTTMPPTTTEPSTTTTTVPDGEQTYSLVGGWVRISFSPGRVELVGAGPNPGYSWEVEDDGPDQVEVEFTNGDHTSKLRASWEGDALDVERDEDDDDD